MQHCYWDSKLISSMEREDVDIIKGYHKINYLMNEKTKHAFNKINSKRCKLINHEL